MTRSVCCLALALLVAACAPPKATLVEETTAPAPSKPAAQPSGPAGPDANPPKVVQQSGMRIPTDRFERLPDRKDMTPTADPKPGGAIAIPPTDDKRNNR